MQGQGVRQVAELPNEAASLDADDPVPVRPQVLGDSAGDVVNLVSSQWDEGMKERQDLEFSSSGVRRPMCGGHDTQARRS
jgi:hypothetical protein